MRYQQNRPSRLARAFWLRRVSDSTLFLVVIAFWLRGPITLLNFSLSSFGFVSDFVLRISDFLRGLARGEKYCHIMAA